MKRKFLPMVFIAVIPFMFTGCIQITLSILDELLGNMTSVSTGSTITTGTVRLEKPVVTLTLSEEHPDSEIKISWTKSADKCAYMLYRSYTRDGETISEKVHESDYYKAHADDYYADSYYDDYEDSREYTDQNLEPKTRYTYTVKAYSYTHADGKRIVVTETSKAISLTTEANPMCSLSTPASLSAVSEEPLTITVSWAPVAGATSYHVFEGKNVSTTSRDFKNVAGTSCTFEATETDKDYTYRVQAWNEDGNYSLFSATVTATPSVPDNRTKADAFDLGSKIDAAFVYSHYDSYWFKCTPNKGDFRFWNRDYDIDGKVYEDFTYSIYKEDGSPVKENELLYNDYSMEGLIPGTVFYLKVNAGNFRLSIE